MSVIAHTDARCRRRTISVGRVQVLNDPPVRARGSLRTSIHEQIGACLNFRVNAHTDA